jgi:type IV pilus assembly protein PilV
MPKINFRHAIGFTLIEVLVSMVILALGLLGLASLQGISLKNNQDAFLFSQANAVAYEMSDRIKVNRQGWVTIPTPAATCATGCDSAAASCTTSQMAAYDYCYWQQKALTVLSTGATAVITKSPMAGSATCTGSSASLCLTMTWSRTNQQLSALMNTTKYQLEVTP